jgi:hypothetical protein
MYCKFAREAAEMYCVLRRKYDIKPCFNIDESMNKCEYFIKVSKENWQRMQDMPDDEFMKNEI